MDIQWKGAPCTGEELAAVERDLAQNMADVGHPSDLIFHVISLSKDRNGPSAFVWGEPGRDCYFAERLAETKWVSVDAEDL